MLHHYYVLVLYAYHETPLAKQNLQHFLTHGALPPDAGEHVYTLNGAHSLTADMFAAENARVVERENTCYDFGARAARQRKEGATRRDVC